MILVIPFEETVRLCYRTTTAGIFFQLRCGFDTGRKGDLAYRWKIHYP